jgi:predicted aspartyl protease
MSGAVRIYLATSLLLSNSATSFGASQFAGLDLATPVRHARVAMSLNATATDLSDKQQYAVSTRRDRIGRIIAPVMINGRGPFRFMLDTGATRTVLAESTLAKLDRIADPYACVPISGVTGSELAAAVHIDTLDAGDLHFRDLSLPVLTGPVLDGIDGILGMDGFDGLKLSADFIRDRITISRSRGERPGLRYSTIPVEFVSERLLMIDVQVGRVRVKAIIDTGGPRTIGNEALLAALIKGRQHIAQSLHTSVVDATQVSQPGMMGRVPVLRLGSATIEDLDVTFGNFAIFSNWGLENEPALLIGMDVLGTLADFTVDFRRKEVDLQPRPLERPVSQTQWHSLTYR